MYGPNLKTSLRSVAADRWLFHYIENRWLDYIGLTHHQMKYILTHLIDILHHFAAIPGGKTGFIVKELSYLAELFQ